MFAYRFVNLQSHPIVGSLSEAERNGTYVLRHMNFFHLHPHEHGTTLWTCTTYVTKAPSRNRHERKCRATASETGGEGDTCPLGMWHCLQLLPKKVVLYSMGRGWCDAQAAPVKKNR